MLIAQPFFAAITGMAVQGKLRLLQPAAQRFGIDAQAMAASATDTTVMGSLLSFGGDNRTRASLTTWREISREFSREKARNFPGELPGKVPGKASWLDTQVSRLSDDGDDDNSQPNTGGCAATRTTDRSGERKWGPARRDGPAGDGLRRGRTR